jgi:predicted RecB family nuclease
MEEPLARLQLSARDFVDHRRPSRCDLRIYLREHGAPVAPPSPFDEMIRRLGRRHEVSVLTALQPVVNLSEGTREQRLQWTRDEIGKGAQVIYQGVLACDTELGGQPCTVVGTPDFLIGGPTGYAIRESRLATNASQQEHLEVVLQLQLYGWLMRQSLEQEPTSLEVATGADKVLAVVDDGGEQALRHLAHLAQLKRLDEPPYEPVEWFKCHACAYVRHCWPAAVARRDVACLPAVDEGLARALHDRGVDTAEQLLAALDEPGLALVERPAGGGSVPVGDAATAIMRSARAFVSGEEELVDTPDLLLSDNYVVFDCEGLPPQFDEFDKIYLWGMRVFGTLPSPYTAAMASSGPDGDRAGWEGFVRELDALFAYYGDIPVIHWLGDERQAVERYIARHGDPRGSAERLLDNLIDLAPMMERTVALPLPGGSLKTVARWVGQRREYDDYGRDWALAKYVEVVETSDESQRFALVGQVQAHNRDDLEATYSILKWLLARAAEPHA